MFCVCEGVAENDLEERLEDLAGLLVDRRGDALHTSTARQTVDGGLRDAPERVLLLRVALRLAVALTLTLARHFYLPLPASSFLAQICALRPGKERPEEPRPERGNENNHIDSATVKGNMS